MEFNFDKGEILLVDKPYEWTSFDVIRKLKHAIGKSTGVKKFKIGHAGTLDPLAIGLLIVCVGKATKKIDQIQAGIKEYTGTFFIGATTPSFDLEMEVNATFPVEHITEKEIQTVAKEMTGKQLQYPPVYSAKSVEGKRLYEHARKNTEVEIKPNEVEILNFEILKSEMPIVEFSISCSKGTYIRSIANDFGKKLNSGAYLHSLIRTKSGEFLLENAKSLAEWVKEISGEEMQEKDSKRAFHRERRK